MAYGNKSIAHCQTTDKANSGEGLNGLHGTPDVLLAAKLQDGGASQKGAKNVNEQQP